MVPRRLLRELSSVCFDERSGGLGHARGRTVTDFAQAGAARDGGGQLDVAGESLDRERPVGENPSEPLDLLNAVDCAGTGVFQSPCQQVAAVMLAPSAAGGAVALQIVGIDVVVELAQLVSADFRAARSTLLFGVVEVQAAAAPPGHGGVGEVG
jgi:hypothetical protein